MTDRVAGLLVICYGQPATRIVELTIDQIRQHNQTTTIRLGVTDIDLPEPVGNLVGRLAAERKSRAVVDSPDAKWLFPAPTPDGP